MSDETFQERAFNYCDKLAAVITLLSLSRLLSFNYGI
jgi:hypothetical protein